MCSYKDETKRPFVEKEDTQKKWINKNLKTFLHDYCWFFFQMKTPPFFLNWTNTIHKWITEFLWTNLYRIPFSLMYSQAWPILIKVDLVICCSQTLTSVRRKLLWWLGTILDKTILPFSLCGCCIIFLYLENHSFLAIGKELNW